MFKNHAECTTCIHYTICGKQEALKEIYDKIKCHWANLPVESIFKLDLSCTEYSKDNHAWYTKGEK